MKERKYRRALITAHTSHNGWAIPKTVIQLNGCGVPVDPSNTSLPYLDIRAKFRQVWRKYPSVIQYWTWKFDADPSTTFWVSQIKTVNKTFFRCWSLIQPHVCENINRLQTDTVYEMLLHFCANMWQDIGLKWQRIRKTLNIRQIQLLHRYIAGVGSGLLWRIVFYRHYRWEGDFIFTCVCLLSVSPKLLIEYLSNFYGTVGNNPRTNRLYFEWPWPTLSSSL